MNTRERAAVMALSGALSDIPFPREGKNADASYVSDMRRITPLIADVLYGLQYGDDDLEERVAALMGMIERRTKEQWR